MHSSPATRLLCNSLPLFLFFTYVFPHNSPSFSTALCQWDSATHNWPPFLHHTQPTLGQNLEIAKLDKIYCWRRGGPAKWVAKSHQCFILEIAQEFREGLLTCPEIKMPQMIWARCTLCSIHPMFCTGYTTFPDSVSQWLVEDAF